MSSPPVTFRLPRPEHRGVLVGLRLPQVLVLAAGVLAAVAAMVVVPSALGLGLAAGALALAAPAALVRVRGRTADQWAPVLARWAAVAALGRRRWRSSLPALGLSEAREWAEPPPSLTGVALLRARRAGSAAAVAVVSDARARTYTAVVSCGSRPFALLDGAEQDRLCQGWGLALAGLAQEGSAVRRVAWVERALPADGAALAAHVAEHATLFPDHPARASYASLVADAGPVTQHHQCFVALSIGGRRARRAVAAAGGGETGAAEVLLREVGVLCDRLRSADVDVEEVLGPRRLAAVLRGAFDPRSAAPLAQRARRRPDEAGTGAGGAWPLATEVSWGHYRADSGCHATYWMAELPRRDVHAGFWSPLLLRSGAIRSVAVVAEPVPPSVATRSVESARASHAADESLRQRAGYLASERRERVAEDLAAREAELAAGHGEFRFSGYVTVSALDPDGLERAAGEVEQLGFDAGIELRRLYGEQDVAFTYTLPLGRGLS
ncbi:MAG TPA: SCO6880 family protein [Acidimicrobiales bacterium]|nr:SCO6880 family protein [Acidimicrobiales bacterium]